MPYIYCEACGAGCYSNVRSCPRCGARVGRAYTRSQTHPGRPRAGSTRIREDVEIEREVREALYGRRLGGVERHPGA
jgi:hypothetical protein